MRFLVAIVVAVSVLPAGAQEIPQSDSVRIHEFYRLASQIQDNIWPQWSAVPAPLLLVTDKAEFLTHHPAPPGDFKKGGDEFYVRPRHFPANLLATFPAFGPPSVIVIGEPENTNSKTSTRWLITLMHEHFHQLQNAHPGYFEEVENLGLSHGDQTGMWMLNYPFPYENPAVAGGFVQLRDALLQALSETDPNNFAVGAKRYADLRRQFFSQLSADDHKYLAFQLWQEGIARYTQIKAAEAGAQYQPTKEYAALADYESFADYAAHARKDTLDELRKADLSKWQREVAYSWGAAEGFLLDRLKPGWERDYFTHLFSLDSFFRN